MNLKRYKYIRSKLLELMKIDFENLKYNFPRLSEDKVANKVYRRNSSLNKIISTCKKYELFIPHETLVPTAIPLFFKREMTNPDLEKVVQARSYIEKYAELNMELEFLSKDEVKRLFEEFTKENVKKMIID
ncbi:TPA: hypothetical protein PBF49_001601 [Staphylococcus aureus]|nr:hypothetical protein [Staphylococcus aureus]